MTGRDLAPCSRKQLVALLNPAIEGVARQPRRDAVRVPGR
jgi:hypothetical protein